MTTYIDLDAPDGRGRKRVHDADEETKEYREHSRHFGVPLRSCYALDIGDSPKLKAGDRVGAQAYFAKIEEALDKGGWSNAERTRLYKLRDKWRRRADGRDMRFEMVGTQPGRLQSDVEGVLRGLQRAQKRHERPKVDRRRRVRDWSLYGDEGPPEGSAKGGRDVDELAGDQGDDETGVGPYGRPLTDRDFIIPGSDGKGNSHRVQCRLTPAHFRALSVIKDEGRFPFHTLGDIVRWCVYRGLKELQVMKASAKVESYMLQVDVISEILAVESAHREFAAVFDSLSHGIDQHVQDQAVGEARRVAAMVKAKIEQMPEGYWREKYMGQLRQRFGHLLDGATQEGVKLA